MASDASDGGRRRAKTGNCPQCSAENDLFYTYCRRCLTELPDRALEETLHER